MNHPVGHGMGAPARAADVFTRGVGVLLVAAFLSLGVQLDVLMGPNGLSPAALSIHSGVDAWRRPGLLWLVGTDLHALWAVLGLGLGGAALLVAGVARPVGVAVAYVCYLTMVHAGGVFFQFQWDNLIAETLVLCALLPWNRTHAPHPLVALAFRALLFKLYFESGVVKWAWGDASWGAHVAMDHYYETAPLPLLAGFVLHQLPHALHVMEGWAALALECVLPWLFLAPARFRIFAVVPGLLLQVMIFATGSYGVFNLWTALLFVWLPGEAHWDALWRWPRWPWQTRTAPEEPLAPVPAPPSRWQRVLRWPAPTVAVLHMAWGAVLFVGMMLPQHVPDAARQAEWVLMPYRPVNSYHLFANVTLQRPAVDIQYSNGPFDDEKAWHSLRFAHAPGAPDQRPPLLLAPHHPRVPFQMWFLALSGRPTPWFQRLQLGLCQPHSAVHGLFVDAPLHDAAPRALRVRMVDYHMASLSNAWSQGVYWTVEVKHTGPVLACR